MGVEGYTSSWLRSPGRAARRARGVGGAGAREEPRRVPERGDVYLLGRRLRLHPGMLGEARRLFRIMETSPLLRRARPNAVTYNAMIFGECTNYVGDASSNGDDASSAPSLPSPSPSSKGGGGARASSHSRSNSNSNNNNHLAAAKKLVAKMRAAGFQPDTVTMNIMLQCIVDPQSRGRGAYLAQDGTTAMGRRRQEQKQGERQQ